MHLKSDIIIQNCHIHRLSHTHTHIYVYTWNNVFIWNVNCAWATAFILDTQTDVLVKVSKFLWQKMSRPEGDSNPQNFGFMPNALTIWAIRTRHLLSHVFEYWLWWDRYIFNKVNIWNVSSFNQPTVRLSSCYAGLSSMGLTGYWNVNCTRATAFIFDTRTGVLVKVSFF